MLFKFVKDMHLLDDSGRLTGAAAKLCLRQLRAVDRILGILDEEALSLASHDLPEEVRALVLKRQAARDAKDFAARTPCATNWPQRATGSRMRLRGRESTACKHYATFARNENAAG